MSVISFFSYKGGSGRTTTTLNTLYYIIQELKPVPSAPLIIIDADTESYGMSMLIRDLSEKYPVETSLQGLCVCAQQDTFTNIGHPNDWLSYSKLNSFFIPVGNYFTNDVENDAVLLLRSDVTPKEQHKKWNKVFSMNGSDDIENTNMSRAVEIMQRCNCTIVFDTPSGTQDMATFALDMSDTIVCCMRPSVQFELGTRLCFSKLIDGWTQDRNGKSIIFCPSAVPYKRITIDSREYPEYYLKNVFANFREELDVKAYDSRGIIKLIWGMQEGEVPGIPEVDRFKWQECCLAKIPSDKEDERLAKDKYQKLAKLVTR